MRPNQLSKCIHVITLFCFVAFIAFGTGCFPRDILDKLQIKTGKWIYEENDQGVEEKIGCVKGGTECFYGSTAGLREGIPIPKWLGEIIEKYDQQNQSVM